MGLEIINIIKKEKGMTSKQLSEKSKVPIGTLNKILNGQTKNPAYETIFALAKALDCSVDMFCDKKDSQISTPILSQDETTLLENYNKSNDEGKKMILSYSDYISKNYKETNSKIVELPANKKETWEEEGKEHLMPVAAHAKENSTEEDIQHDLDMMDDENW